MATADDAMGFHVQGSQGEPCGSAALGRKRGCERGKVAQAANGQLDCAGQGAEGAGPRREPRGTTSRVVEGSARLPWGNTGSSWGCQSPGHGQSHGTVYPADGEERRGRTAALNADGLGVIRNGLNVPAVPRFQLWWHLGVT